MAGAWISLELLKLCDHHFQANFLQDLCKAYMPKIERIDVWRCVRYGDEITSDSTFHLQAVSWSKLKVFDLGGTKINEQVMCEMVKLKFPLLETYILSENDCSPKMIQHLIHCTLPNLTYLHLKGSGVNSSGVQQLVKADWPSLLGLDLSHNKLDVEAVSQLLSCTKWRMLRGMNLSWNYLGRDGLDMMLGPGRILPLQYLDRHSMPEWVKLHWHAIHYIDLTYCQDFRHEY